MKKNPRDIAGKEEEEENPHSYSFEGRREKLKVSHYIIHHRPYLL